MAELVLNVSKVNSYVIPNIRKIEELMQEAYSTSNTLKSALPSTFNYRSNVSDIVSEIYDIKKEVSKVNTLINEKITQAERIENTGDNKISGITSLIHELNAESYVKNNKSFENRLNSRTTFNMMEDKIPIYKSTVTINQTKASEQIQTDSENVIEQKENSVEVSEVEEQSTLDWVGEKIDGAIDFAGEILEATGSFICDLGSTIWDGVTSVFDWVTDGDNWKELLESLGASIANAVISFSKGVVDLVEAIGDTCVIIGTGVATVGTALYDVGYGIATGDWDFNATKGLWEGAKTVVSYDWSNKIYDSLYDTKAGKWLDEHAYAPFKSDGIACQVIEGVGYVAGVVTLSVVTFGAAGVTFGATSTVGGLSVNAGAVGVTAFATGLSKHTSEEWNKNSISLNYGGQDIEIPIDYEKYLEIENLKENETTTVTQQYQADDGSVQEIMFTITSKGNKEYDIIDNIGNVASLNSLNESSTTKGLLKGVGGGIADGFKYYTAISTLGNFQSLAGMIKHLGSGNYGKGVVSLFKNAAKATFKDIGFYIDSGTFISGEIKSGIQTGEWNLKNIGAGIFSAYTNNFLGNLGGEYFGSGLGSAMNNIEKSRVELDTSPYSFNENDLNYKHSNVVKAASNRVESNINRYRYTDTNLVDGLNDSIKENGLYHFSSNVDDIIDSGYVRSSGYFSSYGERKSFFFNGVPEVGAYASNLDGIPLKTEAVKIFPSDDIINSSKLKVRNYDDFAVTYSGDLRFDSNNAAKQYFVLRKVDDKLVYANVNKAFYDNYQNTAEGLAVAEFISKKKNVDLIKQDYYYNLSMKSTNAQITYSKVKNSIIESDKGSIDIPSSINHTINLNDIKDYKKFSDSTELIKKKLCSVYELDYDSNVADRMMVNGIMEIIDENKFTDENVKYIFEHLDKLQEHNKYLSFATYDGTSRYFGGVDQLQMGLSDLDSSCRMVLSHELGHTSYQCVLPGKTKFEGPDLSLESINALEIARQNLRNNDLTVKKLLDDSLQIDKQNFKKTVDWYEGLRENETAKMSSIVDSLYSSDSIENLKELAESASKMNAVKEILSEAGMSDISIEDLISNKELVKQIAISQNNINNQLAHYNKLNSDYDLEGDWRKLSSMIDSISLSEYRGSFGHSKEYWTMRSDSNKLSYDELLADYISVSANGRTDLLDKLQSLCGNEIFDDLKKKVKEMADKMGG